MRFRPLLANYATRPKRVHRGLLVSMKVPLRVVVYLVTAAFAITLMSRPIRAQEKQQQPSTSVPASGTAVNPLARVLHAKGILTDEDMAQLSGASSGADADQRLAKLLLAKGVISQADFDATMAATNVEAASQTPASPAPPAQVVNASAPATGAHATAAVYRIPVGGGASSSAAQPAAPPDPNAVPDAWGSTPNQGGGQNVSLAPSTIPATNPIRAFPVGGIKKGEIPQTVKVGGVVINPYGFIKATAIHDSSSPGGDDFPLPGFLGDTGPNASPEFHVKARSTRFGSNFEWLDPDPNLTITGKFEFDFEGNFNRSDNRNLSSIRSYNPSIRLAYGRLDYKLGDRDTISGVFGQDWTPFGSSTLPNMLETTGLGIAFGDIYERAPQMRFGYTHNFGGFQIMPEIAMVLPAVGDVPAAVDISQQLGFGERQGPDYGAPQVEGRLVGQWQLDHAPGVSPAQLIVSFEHGGRSAIVLASDVPALYKKDFPTGARVGSPTDGVDFEWQFPTRWVTLTGKAYTGSDLRYYFAGQLFSNYNSTFGMTGLATAPSIDGASTVAFGLLNGVPTVAPQLPVRAAGGFAQLGFPISRILGMDPEGRNAGLQLFLLYGTDQANSTDLVHAAPGGSRDRSDMSVGTLNYKLNKWITFAFEESLYRTRANTDVLGLPLFEGIPQHEWRDLRSEGGVIFSF